jgi:hypothetical protein
MCVCVCVCMCVWGGYLVCLGISSKYHLHFNIINDYGPLHIVRNAIDQRFQNCGARLTEGRYWSSEGGGS